jgi:hypothetical protein
MRTKSNPSRRLLHAAGLILAGCMLALCPTQAQTYYKNKAYTWRGNEFIQGKMKARAVSATEMTSTYERMVYGGFMPSAPDAVDRKHWTLKRDLSDLPVYSSTIRIEEALYNLALQESLEAIEPDSTFRTGVFWGGVWTRDVSYSILHALAQLHPDVSRTSLLAKVNDRNRIVQDTGTGGAWPCSTDRTTWVLAAWELYLTTGDAQWLHRIYPIVRQTLEDDRLVAYDAQTGLMHGETSFLDWREQEYPLWAQPADIYQSEALGTTMVHIRSLRILAEMARLEHQPQEAAKYDQWAQAMTEAVNARLWIEDKGYYGIYLYGRQHPILHPQSETLGEAFSILFDVADAQRAARITRSVINEPFGTPCLYPNLADQPPYHNDATWPFVQGYWMKANAKAGNEEGLLHSIASIYRAEAFWLTNQENYIIYNGDYGGTQINSARQLWSVAAALAVVPNIYFGIQYEPDGIRFAPFVPKVLNGTRSLRNFRYRGAVLNLSVSGFGNTIQRFTVDGVEQQEPFFKGDLTGEHRIDITLSNRQPAAVGVTYADNAYQPNTPATSLEGDRLTWGAVENATAYRVLRDGKVIATLEGATLSQPLTQRGEYQVQAVDATGTPSFASEPLRYEDASSKVILVEVEDHALPFDAHRKAVRQSVGVGGGVKADAPQEVVASPWEQIDLNGAHGGFCLLSNHENILVTLPVEVAESGVYAIDWRYANGHGPINTDNRCATRLLSVDGRPVGATVMPQRGEGIWNQWGWSSVLTVALEHGTHYVTLEWNDHTDNMNLTTNEAMVDALRCTLISDK